MKKMELSAEIECENDVKDIDLVKMTKQVLDAGTIEIPEEKELTIRISIVFGRKKFRI
jgi:hypothetical protein